MSLFSGQPHFLLLAQIDVPAEPGNIVLTLGLLALVVSIASNVVSIWHRNKRQPPIEQYVDRELGKLEGRFDSRFTQLTHELAAMRSYNSKNSRELHERIEALGKTISASLNDIHRSIGRIEGKQHLPHS